jgi:hypothetical protein
MSNPQIGLDHYIQQRKEFTKTHKKYTTEPLPLPLDLSTIENDQFDTIHESLLQGRKFLKPTPLSFVFKVLIFGWKKEGVVPRDWPPKKPESD